ncbi:MAG: cytochrome P450 [Polyangiales bacterium]
MAAAHPSRDAGTSTRSAPKGPPPRRGVVDALKYVWGFATDPIGFVGDRFARYGDVYFVPPPATDLLGRFRPGAGNGPADPGDEKGLFVFKHPDHLREVLVTRASSFGKDHTAFRSLSQVLGEGLLTTDGDQWKRQRRMVAPAFAPARLAGYARVMTEESLRTVRDWRDDQVIDLGAEMTSLTLRVVSRALFGHDSTGDTASVAHAMSTFQDWLTRPDVFPRAISPQRRAIARSIETLDRIIYGLIEKRRAHAAGKTGNDALPDLLGLLVTAVDEEGDGGTMSEREVRDQLVTLFLAGHETTSHALTWTIYLLSQHPEATAKLHDELGTVLGGRAAEYDDLPKLPWTGQVFDEAMRLYPPVYSLARRATEDTEIGGYAVRAGSEVMLWTYFTQRDARFFPEPEAFRPERFAPGEEAKLPRMAYLPFGGGPRACIGKAFATMEGRLLLANLVQRFSFELVKGQRVAPRPKITLVPKRAVKMRLHAR